MPATIFCLSMVTAACEGTPAIHAEYVRQLDTKARSDGFLTQARPQQIVAQPAETCQHVRQLILRIRVIPLNNDELGEDPDVAFRDVKTRGKSIIWCLLNLVEDVTLVPDPRQVPKYSRLTLGDVAFFLIEAIIDPPEHELVSMFPEPIRNRWKEEGIWAYFKFVESREGRRSFHKALEAWLRKGGWLNS
ncbi:MAG: hypothetical protein HYV07_18530 [Deltaproteobacteria bacterium]|nr:hypothetical protein [Deltaproteobacteria bacterium]